MYQFVVLTFSLAGLAKRNVGGFPLFSEGGFFKNLGTSAQIFGNFESEILFHYIQLVLFIYFLYSSFYQSFLNFILRSQSWCTPRCGKPFSAAQASYAQGWKLLILNCVCLFYCCFSLSGGLFNEISAKYLSEFTMWYFVDYHWIGKWKSSERAQSFSVRKWRWWCILLSV